MSKDESLNIKIWKQRTEELEKIVAEKTADLLLKNRELEIEASLERVRTVALSMMRSDELANVSETIFRELKQLGFDEDELRNCQILINNDQKGLYHCYKFDDQIGKETADLPYNVIPLIFKIHEQLLKSPEAFADIKVSGSELESWKKYVKDSGQKIDKKFFALKELYYYFYSIGIGAIGIASYTELPESKHEILKRFKNVFGLCYQRYLDIALAEAQAKEAKIETSLEKVRSKALSMHKSEDFTVTSLAVFNELRELGLDPVRSGLSVVLDESKKEWEAWSVTEGPDDKVIPLSAKFTSAVHPVSQNIFENWKKQTPYWQIELAGDDLKSFVKGMPRNYVPIDTSTGKLPYKTDRIIFHYFSFPDGVVFAGAEHSYSEEEISILKRFTQLFAFSYKRYLELKEAEANARESQIEAALERVRSKTMAMHNSSDVGDTVVTLFEEVLKLGLDKSIRCGIGILEGFEQHMETWSATSNSDGKVDLKTGMLNMNMHPMLIGLKKAWKNGESGYSYDYIGKDVYRYYDSLNREPDYPIYIDLNTLPENEYHKSFFYKEGILFAFAPNPISEEASGVLDRFAKVFGQTYRRFLDLQLAEEQARKAKIETALERVRSRALAMQEPEELHEVVKVLREEMGLMKIEELESSHIFIYNKDTEISEAWYAIKNAKNDTDKLLSGNATLELNKTSFGREILKFFRSDEQEITIPLTGEAKSEWKKYSFSLIPEAVKFFGDDIPDRTCYLCKFNGGAIGGYSSIEITDESWELLRRAASVFSLAYSRFKDLNQAKTDLKNLKDEKKRSDSLLLNILPEEIAAELKQFGRSYARNHEQVSIMFADIKGFSSIAESLSASELVTQLDECFRAFDYIVEKHGLEKIKTVGDAYICASGLPNPDPDNAIKTVKAALDMMDYIKGFAMTKKIQDLPAFEFRIGIHTGPVITGVVGLKKFTYDIWGDTVNLAARMEQHGEAGKINISGNTYELVKNKLKCTHRGKIEAKNKGVLDMYFVDGVV